jgi:hypothetical protein
MISFSMKQDTVDNLVTHEGAISISYVWAVCAILVQHLFPKTTAAARPAELSNTNGAPRAFLPLPTTSALLAAVLDTVLAFVVPTL